jgi:hypothetical protein
MTDRDTLIELAKEAAYERGYRRGRIEASAELHALYRGRILEATTILAAPIPATPQKDET